MTDLHYDKIRIKSIGKFSYPKFIKLKELAAETVGITQDYHIDRLLTSISYVEKLNKDIKDIEIRIADLMKKYPTYFESIKGIGTITAAIILGEYGNISLYDNPSQMVSYAGLDSTIKQSGTIATTGKLVKRGSKYLRSSLINITLLVMANNPSFYAYYHKKKKEGKHHRVAQVNLAKN